MIHTIDNLRNPFTDLYHWVKGELYDLAALECAVEARISVDKNLRSLHKKKVSTQKDIESVTSGKTTVTTLFKNTSDVGNMSNKVENADREIESNTQLLELMTIYLG